MLGWRGFVMVAVGGFWGAVAFLAVFVLLMNPYGNLPHILFSEHAITDINQRFQYPALVRSGRYDSIVIGASDSRLLHPKALERVFGGHFANLAMNAGQAYEQYRLADLFIRQVKQTRTLLIGLDHVWCKEDALEQRTTFRGFPEWMYDDNQWNDLVYMLNAKSIEISGRRLGVALGLKSPRFPAGYEVFTPPESAYDPIKVRHKLWGEEGPRTFEAAAADNRAHTRSDWMFPALGWLDEILGRVHGRKVLAFMPSHVAAQPIPGSGKAARADACKMRIAEIAARHGASFIDFNIRSAITTDDDNYWDRLHYRLPIADRIVRGIQQALATGKDDPNGDWRYLAGPEMVEISSTR
jgi:hypothetical protein